MKNVPAPELPATSFDRTGTDRLATRPARHALVRFVTSAPVRLFIALSVVGSALAEIVREFEEVADLWQHLGAEHGIFLIGAAQFLHALGDLLEGVNETIDIRQESIPDDAPPAELPSIAPAAARPE
jgi:hypothetical protein